MYNVYVKTPTTLRLPPNKRRTNYYLYHYKTSYKNHFDHIRFHFRHEAYLCRVVGAGGTYLGYKKRSLINKYAKTYIH